MAFDERGCRATVVAAVRHRPSGHTHCSLQSSVRTAAAAWNPQCDWVQPPAPAPAATSATAATTSSDVHATPERQAQQHTVCRRQRPSDDCRRAGVLSSMWSDRRLQILVVPDRSERQGQHVPLGDADVLLLDACVRGGSDSSSRVDLRPTR